uniref:Si:ch211-244b2.4 n=1 Tax=Astyanax mexicanus TaxID=7994 RepID=W5KE35_ASTMX
MAEYEDSGEESVSGFSDTDTDSHADSQSGSDSDQDSAATQKVCKYYNEGNCRYGKKCRDMHVCKYSLKGNCRYGSSCRFKHIQGSDRSSRQEYRGRRSQGDTRRGYRHRSRSRSDSSDESLSGRPYKWQLDLGQGWEDVAHDYILEAQYSRPNTKGIRIYNTPCGALSIDFTKMRILKKTKLRVRRKGSRQNEWLWHYRGNHGWYQYGEKDSKGNASSISSASLEKEYQKNRQGTVQFTIDSTTYEIRFRDMSQKNLSTGHRRRIRRRPKYESPRDGGVNVVTRAFKKLTSSSSNKAPLWQYGGKSGRWHSFSHRGACSVSSEDIEEEYQNDPQGSISFTVNGDPYTIDFKKMTQTNTKTSATRQVQRV